LKLFWKKKQFDASFTPVLKIKELHSLTQQIYGRSFTSSVEDKIPSPLDAQKYHHSITSNVDKKQK
jgi:hypothetical protein